MDTNNGGMDEDLQHELDAALSDMDLDSLMDVDGPGTPTGAEGVRKGKVIAIRGEDIFVDMGGRSQGILSSDQFVDEALPEVGQYVEVTIVRYDGSEGLLLLSRQGAVQAATWQSIEEGVMVEGRVTGHNKGGLELDIDGIRAFMPISQIAFERIEAEELSAYVNRRMRCAVVEVRRDEKSVIVSHREVLQQEKEQAAARMFETLEEGQIVSGTVRTIMPYGAFVDIGGADGLLHIGDMSFSRVEDPKDVVQEGQQLEVMVLKVDRETRKIGLGLKQVMPDPWTDVANKWPADTVVSGRVTRLMDFGAFLELEPGVEGLIPISEMTFERRIRHPSEVVSEGDLVKVRVMNVDPEARRISLSIKQVGEDPWVGALVRWSPESVVEGTVTRITEFGAFVEIVPGVEGLVHISELSDQRVRSVNEVVQEGQKVNVKVLSVDEDKRRISLSIKQLAQMPDYTGVSQDDSERPKPKKKRKKPLKGGLDW